MGISSYFALIYFNERLEMFWIVIFTAPFAHIYQGCQYQWAAL